MGQTSFKAEGVAVWGVDVHPHLPEDMRQRVALPVSFLEQVLKKGESCG